MRMNSHHWWLLLLLGLTLSTHAQQVSKPHFYQQNQHRCNCASNKPCDENNGTCYLDMCAPSYIGVTCQHRDVHTVVIQSNIPPQIMDGDDSTCLTKPLNETVVYDFDKPIHFIWVFLYGNDSAVMKPHLALYKQGAIQDIHTYFLILNQRSLLIKLHQGVMYDRLVLSNLPDDLCSLEVSLGRNLAFPSTPNQSGIYTTRQTSRSYNAFKAVDGSDASGKFPDSVPYYSCSVTAIRGPQWWRIRLQHDAKVNTVLIMTSRGITSRRRMSHFVLKTFTSDNALAYRHEDQSDKLDRTTSVHVAVEDLIREIEISASGKQLKRCNSQIILCEMYIYGEFHCRGNMYGPLCERYCPDGCSRHLCDPDWGCPQGCSKNWTGEWCSTSCQFKYGENCQLPCPDHCGGLGDCDRTSGACQEGCSAGFRPPFCTEPCPLGTYDVNCLKSCSHCKENATTGVRPCDRTYGTCLIACDDGYYGDLCEKIKIFNSKAETAMKFGIAGLFVVFLLILCYKSVSRASQDLTLEESKPERVHEETQEGQNVVGSSVDPEIIQNSEETDSSSDSSEGIALAGALAERLKWMVFKKPSTEKLDDIESKRRPENIKMENIDGNVKSNQLNPHPHASNESTRTRKDIIWERGPHGITLKVINSQVVE